MGIMIVGDIECIVNEIDKFDYDNEKENENEENENEEKDIYEQILKSMSKYNFQYDKFKYYNSLKENYVNSKSKPYVASSPIPIPNNKNNNK
jgi:hypothetical protein